MATRYTTQNGDISSAATWGGTLPTSGDTAIIQHTCTQSGYAFPSGVTLTIDYSGSLTLTGTGNTLPNLQINNGGVLTLSSGSGTVGNVSIDDLGVSLTATPVVCNGGTYSMGSLYYTQSATVTTVPALCRVNGGSLTVWSVFGANGVYAESGWTAIDGIHVYGGTLTATSAYGGAGAEGTPDAGGNGIRCFGGTVTVSNAYGGNGGAGGAYSGGTKTGGNGGHGVYANNPTSAVTVTISAQAVGGSGGAGHTGSGDGDGGTGGNGGYGCYLAGSNITLITPSTMHGGIGGQGGNGGHANSYSGGAGGAGGHALCLNSVLVQSEAFASSMYSWTGGNGGSGGDNYPYSYAAGGNGGGGGAAVVIQGALASGSYVLGKLVHGVPGDSGVSQDESYGSIGTGGSAGAGIFVGYGTITVGTVVGGSGSYDFGLYCRPGASLRPKGSISGRNYGSIVLPDQHELFDTVVEWRMENHTGTVNMTGAEVLVPGKFYYGDDTVLTNSASAFRLTNAAAQACVVPNVPVRAYHDYPAPADVRAGVQYGDGSLTGTLETTEPSVILFA